MYDTKFRALDTQLGRWWQKDPLSEFHYDISSYNYVLNNPISFTDPFGLDTVRTKVKEDRINIPKNPNQNDVLSITNPDGSISHYTYDPKNPNANSKGYVGSGTESTNDEVVISNKQESKSNTKNNEINNALSKIGVTTGVLSDIYILKKDIGRLPKWFRGSYKSAHIPGSKPYTSFTSLGLRRLGWQHGGRILQTSGTALAYATIIYDNGTYYDQIVNSGGMPASEIKEHYSDVSLNPMMWLYNKLGVENWLIDKLGDSK